MFVFNSIPKGTVVYSVYPMFEEWHDQFDDKIAPNNRPKEIDECDDGDDDEDDNEDEDEDNTVDFGIEANARGCCHCK